MLNVREETKRAFMDGGSKKYTTITFKEAIIRSDGTKSDYVVTNDRIVGDSLSTKYSIQSGKKLDFIGCISSTSSFKMFRSIYVLKDKEVEIKVRAEGSDEEIIVFTGKVDEVDRESDNALVQKVTCYDKMHELLDEKDVTEWYDKLNFPMTLKEFRNSLFKHLGIDEVPIDLPRDKMIIYKTLDTSKKEEDDTVRRTQITAATVIQSICQVNAVFGQISTDGKMKYIRLDTESEPYPYTNNLIHKAKHEDIALKKITGVVLYDGSSEEYRSTGTALAYYPEDKTKVEGDDAVPYTIEDNFILYAMNQADSIAIAKDLYETISKVSFIPCEITAFGMPWMECGDKIRFVSIGPDTLYPDVDLFPDTNLFPSGYDTIDTIIMTKKFSGTGMYTDEITADGEDINSSITTLNEIIEAERFYRKIGEEKLYSEIEQTKEEIKFTIYNKENGVMSLIDQQADRIEMVVERQEFDYSAITTRLILTEQAIELHAKEINMESETLKIVTEQLIEFNTNMIDFNTRLVNFNDTKVNIVDLATGGKTVINGANITTGFISCARLCAGSISIGEESYDVDWVKVKGYDYDFTVPGAESRFVKGKLLSDDPDSVQKFTFMTFNELGIAEKTEIEIPTKWKSVNVVSSNEMPSDWKPTILANIKRKYDIVLGTPGKDEEITTAEAHSVLD